MTVTTYNPHSPEDRAAIRARLANLSAGATPRVKEDPAKQMALMAKARETGRSLTAVSLEALDAEFAAAKASASKARAA